MAGLIIKNVSKSFNESCVLKNINLELVDGELIVLLGPSGCGKSTLLRIVAGLESADTGEIYISNTRIDQKEPKNRNVALVFQNYALYPHMTVEKNLAFPLLVAKIPKIDIKKRVLEVAELLGLSEKLKEKPGRLSGGERQRVALGRAIIREPAIFLLDEPLSNLDADLRSRMRREIVALQRRMRKTLIHVTHDQTEALTMADRIVLMNKGEIIQVGTPRDLYQNPVDLFTAKFIGYPPINLIKSKVLNGMLSPLGMALSDAHLPDKSHDFLVGFRPEDLILNENGKLAGKVEACEYLGGQVLLRIESNGIRLISLAPLSKVTAADEVRFSVSPDALLFFDCESQKRLGSR